MAHKWTPEQRAALSAKAKARWAESGQTRIGGQVGKDVPLQPPPLETAAPPTTEALETERPETVPPNYMNGKVRRLEDHAPRPGWVRYWQNDDKGGSTIAAMLKSGWTFVDRQDAQLNEAITPRNNDLGSRVRQVVGTDEAGQPMYAYLMEKPEWLYNQHKLGPGSQEEYHCQLEAQIGAGTLGEKRGENRYSASKPFRGQPTSLPAISMDTSVKTHR